MKERLLTAAVGVPLCIFAIVVQGWFAELLIFLLTFAALVECYRALSAANYDAFPYGAYLAALLMWPLKHTPVGLDLLIMVSGAMGITLTGVILSSKPSFPNACASVYPIFTCFMPFAMLMTMLNSTYGQVWGASLIAMAIAVAFLCDGLAYFGGRTLGKHKLCPTVSPKKTVEGAVFGLLGGVIAAVGCRHVIVHLIGSAMPGNLAVVVLGLIGGAAGEIGDLTASLLKRHSGIKDYGHIFPGHGGVMDRFDSVIMTIIVMYCYTLILR